MSLVHRHYLAPLFEPRSVLLVADGDALPPWAETVLAQLGSQHLPHALLDLRRRGGPQQTHELALIAVPATRVAYALRRAARAGCSAALVVCDASQPAQAQAWAAQARTHGMRLLGPGSMGFVRPALGFDAGRTGSIPAIGNVALVSQSGALNAAILDWAAGSAIGFSLVVSLGGEADVDLAQVLDYLANDQSTKSVMLYLESVRESRRFMSAIRALATVKPVVVLKGRRTQAVPLGRAAPHSGAFAGSDAIYTAALRRAGAVQVRLFTQLFVASRILSAGRWPAGNRLAVLGNGNGPEALAADVAAWTGIALPAFAESTRRALTARFARMRIANPLDLGIDASAQVFADAIGIIAGDPQIDVVLVMFTPNAGVDARAVTDAVIAAARGLGKPLYACWMGDASVRALWRRLDDAGVPVFRTPETAVDAYASVAAFEQNQALLQQTPRSLSSMQPPDLDGARMLLDGVLADKRDVLTEMESKALLAAFHVPVSRTVIARSVTEAIIVAEQIGFPLAMKISSPDIASKSEVGGVVLNVRNAAEVREHYAGILAAVRRAQAQARIDGVTLQAMHAGAFGRELYVGVVRDPVFGPVIAFGAGGRRLDLIRDTTLELPPLNRFLARRMIERTRISAALGESQGTPAVDLEQLERLLVRVSEMACELPCLAYLDINPLLIDEQGAIAVDARVVLDASCDSRQHDHAHLAILPYPSQLTRAMRSPDGRFYTIRAIRPEDADRLQAFVRGLSEESRYFRFVSTLAELTPRMLVRYTQVDYDRELALVAVIGPDELTLAQEGGTPEERIIGVVRYLLNPDGESCEFAVAIADDWQGNQLGSTLMRAIVDAARDKGLRRIEGYVLATNARMLALMTHLGFTVQGWNEDPTMRLVTMELGAGQGKQPD